MSARQGESTPDDGPTIVPRKEGVEDSGWNRADVVAVREAQADAAQRATSRRQLSALMREKALLAMTETQLSEMAQELGQPKFRGKQLRLALLSGARSVSGERHNCCTVFTRYSLIPTSLTPRKPFPRLPEPYYLGSTEISTLPKAFRESLATDGWRTGRSVLYREVSSPDGTRKFLLQLKDGRVVETVGIPVDEDHGGRLTTCVSSAVGCPMKCTFCATGDLSGLHPRFRHASCVCCND